MTIVTLSLAGVNEETAGRPSGCPTCDSTILQIWGTVPKPVRVLGIDGFYASINGQDSGMVVAVDMGTGNPVALARIDEKDRPALFAWLRVLKEEYGVEVLVSDDFNSYSTAAQRLDLEHQVCRFHYLRWVNRLLNALQKKLGTEWTKLLAEVRQLLQDLPPDGRQRIYQLYRQVKAPPRISNQPMHPLARLQKLLLRLSDNWHCYRLFLEQSDVPATNNATERTIGR